MVAGRERGEAVGLLFLFTGLLLLGASVLYDARLLGLVTGGAVPDGARARIPSARLVLALAGAALLLLGWLIRPRLLAAGADAGAPRFALPARVHEAARRFFGRALPANLVVALLPIATLVFLAETCLAPFARIEPKQTTIFVKDKLLDWKLRRGVTDWWGGVKVTINAKGTRGPEVPYARDPGRRRILWLGDSVTFGYGLAFEDTYPARVHELLEEQGVRMETVNAAVGGYATWQERVWLQTEGIKYSPDLVILAFVLNDVVDGKDLVRFGGRSQGYQLSQSYYSAYDWLVHHSALMHFVERLRLRIVLGPDKQEGAKRIEMLSVKKLLEKPEDPAVQATWKDGLRDLEEVYSWCREKGLRLLVLIVPESMQLFSWSESLTSPQRIVAEHAARNGVPVLDLLPAFRRRLAEERAVPHEYFLDHNHLSARGCRAAADAIAAFVREHGLLHAE